MRLRCSTLLQEKRVSALTVNSLHAEPKAAKTKIERLCLSAISRRNLGPTKAAHSFWCSTEEYEYLKKCLAAYREKTPDA